MIYDADRQECLMLRTAGARCPSHSSQFRFDRTERVPAHILGLQHVHLCASCAAGEVGRHLEAAGYRKVRVEGMTYLAGEPLEAEMARATWQSTFDVIELADGVRMTCHLCGHDTMDPHDVKQRYCRRCNYYHVPPGMSELDQQDYTWLQVAPGTWTPKKEPPHDEHPEHPEP